MAEPEHMISISVGLDDGYAVTKVALPDGRLVAIASRARVGRAHVTWLNTAEQRIAEYETEGTVYAVGDIDGEPTHFEGYPYSGMNRAIVQHALQQCGLAGASVNVVSGLPVGGFCAGDGARRTQAVDKKRESLQQAVRPVDGALPASIAFHEVIPEALAAWYDYVIVEQGQAAKLDPQRLSAPIAVVDIGGRTTDCVVVAEQGVRHESSGSLRCGMLDVKQHVALGIQARFGLETLAERALDRAVTTQRVRLFGKDHDVSDLVAEAKREVLERLHAETRRQLGLGAELEQILFVGGGAVALAEDIRDWFPNQVVAEHPAFANARGMLKYLRYVCDEPGAA